MEVSVDLDESLALTLQPGLQVSIRSSTTAGKDIVGVIQTVVARTTNRTTGVRIALDDPKLGQMRAWRSGFRIGEPVKVEFPVSHSALVNLLLELSDRRGATR